MPPRKGRRAPSKKAADFWPASLAHLREPFLADGDEHVVIAEICGEAVNGYAGMRQVYTCLVPLDEIDAVLSSPGGIGWHVESWGPLPVVGPQGGWDGSFWVEGAAGSGRKYEALVHAWTHHDRTVMAPDNSLLMCYGLVPRILDKERILWDDPSKPVYDVLEVKPLSTYVMPDTHPHAYVRVRRDYLEDYASLKGCGVVAVYYEERRSNGDQVLTDALGEDEGREFVLLGRRVAIARGTRDWLVQAWGCRLVLKPAARPVSEEDDAEDLVWPGGKMLKDFDVLESVFVRDEALQEWESRDEFSCRRRAAT